jgi:hypothetical protein
LDLMGPFPVSSKANKYLLVVGDVFTKWICVSAFREATAGVIVKHLEQNVFLQYGVPKSIICDQASQLTGKVFFNMAKDHNISLWYCTPYTPQANPVERVNRIIKTMIACYVKDKHQHWDANLNEFVFALRTAVHESTGYSPAQLFLNHEMVWNNPEPTEDDQEIALGDREKFVSEKRKRMEELIKYARENLKRAHKKNETHYNLRHRKLILKVGDLVKRKNYVLSDASKKFTAKLAQKFVGPLKVKKKISDRIYELEDLDGNPHGRWHVKDLEIWRN